MEIPFSHNKKQAKKNGRFPSLVLGHQLDTRALAKLKRPLRAQRKLVCWNVSDCNCGHFCNNTLFVSKPAKGNKWDEEDWRLWRLWRHHVNHIRSSIFSPKDEPSLHLQCWFLTQDKTCEQQWHPKHSKVFSPLKCIITIHLPSTAICPAVPFSTLPCSGSNCRHSISFHLILDCFEMSAASTSCTARTFDVAATQLCLNTWEGWYWDISHVSVHLSQLRQHQLLFGMLTNLGWRYHWGEACQSGTSGFGQSFASGTNMHNREIL